MAKSKPLPSQERLITNSRAYFMRYLGGGIASGGISNQKVLEPV